MRNRWKRVLGLCLIGMGFVSASAQASTGARTPHPVSAALSLRVSSTTSYTAVAS